MTKNRKTFLTILSASFIIFLLLSQTLMAAEKSIPYIAFEPYVKQKNSTVVFPDAQKLCKTEDKLDHYAECTTQKEIFDAAVKYALQHEQKLLLIYGANWCPACHALKAELEGWFDPDDEDYHADTPRDAKKLSNYVSKNFTILYIASDANDADDQLRRIGADPDEVDGVPAAFAVSPHTLKSKYVDMEWVGHDETELAIKKAVKKIR